MHDIEPYYGWLKFYDCSEDKLSPFFRKQYNYDLYSENIYGYYIDPAWDYFGSETLYLKIIFAEYSLGYAILEFIGEWNDAINNDIMHLKRNIIEDLQYRGITKFILIGENVFNFHGSDDCYYEEWYEELNDMEQGGEGWVAVINFRAHVLDEWREYNVDAFFHWGADFEILNWRTMLPAEFCRRIDTLITKRIELF